MAATVAHQIVEPLYAALTKLAVPALVMGADCAAAGHIRGFRRPGWFVGVAHLAVSRSLLGAGWSGITYQVRPRTSRWSPACPFASTQAPLSLKIGAWYSREARTVPHVSVFVCADVNGSHPRPGSYEGFGCRGRGGSGLPARARAAASTALRVLATSSRAAPARCGVP